MDNNKKAIIQKQINKTIENLKKNNMQAFYVPQAQDARKKVEEILNEGEVISCGGSVTLQECSIKELMRSGKYKFLDREKEGLTANEKQEILLKALTCDTYLSSANAITANGEIYNVDGYSNRVAAILFGPKSVIIVAGYNKIVQNLDEAITRVKRIAAPANCVRLNCETFCKNEGECVSLKKGGIMVDGCTSEQRICANYVVSAYQRIKDRIKVIIVGEELGY